MTDRRLVLGTRGSALALRQAHLVRGRLEGAGVSVEIRTIKTTGDRILDVPLSDVGDKGLFTKELDRALLDGEIHLAVHSLKDLPTRVPPGLALAVVTKREDARDAFVARPGTSFGLDDLPAQATVGTASLRRRAQLLAWRDDLRVVAVRGNVDTRLRKLEEGTWAGIVLAVAGLRRLGLHAHITTIIPTDVMLPAVGQGALGIVCAAEDVVTRALLRETIHHSPTYKAVIAERAFLRRLEGGCSVPIGCYATVTSRSIELEGCIAALDGRQIVRGRRSGSVDEGDLLGTDLAEELLTRGGRELLDEVRERSS